MCPKILSGIGRTDRRSYSCTNTK